MAVTLAFNTPADLTEAWVEFMSTAPSAVIAYDTKALTLLVWVAA